MRSNPPNRGPPAAVAAVYKLSLFRGLSHSNTFKSMSQIWTVRNGVQQNGSNNLGSCVTNRSSTMGCSTSCCSPGSTVRDASFSICSDYTTSGLRGSFCARMNTF